MLLDIIHISTKCTSYRLYSVEIILGCMLNTVVVPLQMKEWKWSKKSINQFYTSNDEFGFFAPLSGLIAYSLRIEM